MQDLENKSPNSENEATEGKNKRPTTGTRAKQHENKHWLSI